jgi:hypothetical protein
MRKALGGLQESASRRGKCLTVHQFIFNIIKYFQNICLSLFYNKPNFCPSVLFTSYTVLDLLKLWRKLFSVSQFNAGHLLLLIGLSLLLLLDLEYPIDT